MQSLKRKAISKFGYNIWTKIQYSVTYIVNCIRVLCRFKPGLFHRKNRYHCSNLKSNKTVRHKRIHMWHNGWRPELDRAGTWFAYRGTSGGSGVCNRLPTLCLAPRSIGVRPYGLLRQPRSQILEAVLLILERWGNPREKPRRSRGWRQRSRRKS